MSLKEIERIALPEHQAEGDFDHAAVDSVRRRLYVAHTANDAVDVVDLTARRFVRSLPELKGVAGVWVSEERQLLFTSNRGEDTASAFRLDDSQQVVRAATGTRPNGMAFDGRRGVLMVAGVGNARAPDSPPTLTFLATADGRRVGQLTAPGRTRWATYHPASDSFFVNIADPSAIAVVSASDLSGVGRLIPIPAVGPHGLEQDPDGRTLYCACDESVLVTVELPSGATKRVAELAGPPDVLWLNRELRHLYCAIGDPGVVQVFALGPVRLLETVKTAAGAGTLTFDPTRNEVHSFLPEAHEDLVLRDG